MYFLKRYQNTKSQILKEKYKEYLFDIIRSLKAASIEEDGMMRWDTVLVQSEKLIGCNLSLSHGITSIVNFMSRLMIYDDFKSLVEEDIKKTVKYILQSQNKKEHLTSCFPSWVEPNKNEGSNEVLKEQAIEIFLHASLRREDEDTLVKDAGICHGSFGIMHIFQFMYEETGIYKFKEAAEFWITYSFDIGTHKDGYAGYMKWQGGENAGWKKEYVLLDGVAGIGLTLISYLDKDLMSWNECLMIS